MCYYIKENDLYAKAEISMRKWTGSGWGADEFADLETNVPEGTVLTWDQFQKIVAYWTDEAVSDGWDLTDMTLDYTDYDDLDFCLDMLADDARELTVEL